MMISYRKQAAVWINRARRRAGIKSQVTGLYHCVPRERLRSSKVSKMELYLLSRCCFAASPVPPPAWEGDRRRGREIKENWGINMVHWQWLVTLRKWKYAIGSNNTNLQLTEMSSDSNLLTSWDSLLLRVRAASSWPSKEHTWACLVWSSWLRRSLLFTAALASSWTIWSSLCTDWSSPRTSSF